MIKNGAHNRVAEVFPLKDEFGGYAKTKNAGDKI